MFYIVLLSVFFNFEKKIPVLDTLASFAFTIYFFHIFVFTGVNRLVQLSATFWSFGNYNAIGSYALGLFCVFITITLIVILGKFLKLLLGNYSRNVIGC